MSGENERSTPPTVQIRSNHCSFARRQSRGALVLKVLVDALLDPTSVGSLKSSQLYLCLCQMSVKKGFRLLRFLLQFHFASCRNAELVSFFRRRRPVLNVPGGISTNLCFSIRDLLPFSGTPDRPDILEGMMQVNAAFGDVITLRLSFGETNCDFALTWSTQAPSK